MIQKNNFNKKSLTLKIIKYLILFLIIFFLLITTFRLSIVGQTIDNFVFQLPFGILKYFLYFYLFFQIIFYTFKKKIFKINKINKKSIIKIIWCLFNIFWITGLLTTIFLNINNNILVYKNYSFNNIFSNFWKEYKENNVVFQENIKFFIGYKQFILITEKNIGGIIGLTIATLFNYTYIISSIILNFFSLFFMFSFLFFNHPFYLLFKKEKRNLIKWKNMKDGFKKIKFKPETMNQIHDENITIEVPIVYKMSKKADNIASENLKLIKKQHQEKIEEKEKENTKEIEWEIPEFSSNKNDKNKNIVLENLNKEKEHQNIKNNINNNNNNNNDNNNIYPKNDIYNKINNQNIEEIKKFNKIESFKNKNKIENVLKIYNVNANVNNFYIGPTFTKFEIELGTGVKVQKFKELKEEFEIELASNRIRIEAPIPGKSAVGIEIPNKKRLNISWNSVIKDFKKENNSLKLLIGKDVIGNAKIIQLEKQPHLLIAGATGGGKSVCLLSVISSLISQHSPEELKLLLIDPKQVELTVFNDLPHLVRPIINDNKIAILALKNVLKIIKKRFEIFKESKTNKIDSYNYKNPDKKIPYFVVIIDELADLMFSNKKDVEDSIIKITQIARAAGVFLVIATQRPSTDVLTGLIKANIPGRIAFNVSNQFDSRTILNKTGAEQLLGYGDMLILNPLGQKISRAQGVYIKNEEINTLVNYWKNKNYKNNYWKNFINLEENLNSIENVNFNENDLEIYEKTLNLIKNKEYISISWIQRYFSIGYNKAAKITEKLENEKKIVKSGNKYKIID